MRILVGDVDRNGVVLAGDMLAIKTYVGQGGCSGQRVLRTSMPTAASWRGDMLAIKTYVGNVAASCP